MTRKETRELIEKARKELERMTVDEMAQWWKCNHSKNLDEKGKILMKELRLEYKKRTKRELPA